MYVRVYRSAEISKGHLGAIPRHHVDLKQVETPYRRTFPATASATVCAVLITGSKQAFILSFTTEFLAYRPRDFSSHYLEASQITRPYAVTLNACVNLSV
jgi:hypothetical protein